MLFADATIELRKKYRIKLPDAIIYATALVERQSLLTNNTVDFIKLDNQVKLINPFDLWTSSSPELAAA